MANLITEHNERITEELIKNQELIKDKRWRMDNLYFLITKDGKKEVFKMNRAQLHFFDNYLSVQGKIYHRHIILKARQLGFTTFIDLFILDEILFNTNREALIVAHKVEDATQIFDKKIDFAIRNMSPDVKGAFFKINHNSARKIQVVVDYGPEKGSTSSIAVSVSGRSGTYHLVHISEFAKMCVMFPKRAEEVETGTFPTVPFDGFIFIESTAEGMAGRFYEIFNENWNNREKITPQLSQVQFLPHFYNWQYDDAEMKKIVGTIPTSQMEVCEIDWEEYKNENRLTDLEITYYYMKWLQFGGKGGTDAVKRLKQEYPTTPEEAFLSTGQNYFPIAKVASFLQQNRPGVKGELHTNDKGDIEFLPNSQGNFEMFNKPEIGTKYIIGGDTSEGLAHGDAQVLYVINHKTENCDGLYKSQVPPDELATEAYKLGKFYNWGLLAIESNKDGLWVNDALQKLGYVNLYARKIFDDITQKITHFYGWKTTSSTRSFALVALKAAFLRKSGGFPSALLKEMFTFIRNIKGKPEAMDKKNDDCFVRDTLILTDKGNIPIQHIKVGDLVLTRNGYRPVEFTRSRYKKVINNIGLTGTPSHKVIIGDGFKTLNSISHSDTLHIWNQIKNQIEKLSYIEAKNIIDTLIQKGDNSESIFGDIVIKYLFHFIDNFGLITLEKFQDIFIFITRMTTLLIMKLKIWRCLINQNMLSCICVNLREEGFQVNLQKNKERDFMKPEPCGEKQKKVLSLIYETLLLLYSSMKEMLFVVFVKPALNLGCLMLNIVLISVQICIRILGLGQRRKVYNLQVFDTHEYFANGILVKNCVMAASIGYAVLQEQGKYIADKTGTEGFSHLSVMFGEKQ